MAQKGIREFDAKKMLAKFLPKFTPGGITYDGKVALVSPETDWNKMVSENPWLNSTKLVVKPDQLFGKRGKNKLLLLDADLNGAKNWITERMNKEVQVGKSKGELTHFLIEPFVPHTKEYYIAIKGNREGDTIYFSLAGGIDVEENWNQVKNLNVGILEDIENVDLSNLVPTDVGEARQAVKNFIVGLFKFYRQCGYAYLEINPFTLVGNAVVPLDTVAKIDDTAAFECTEYWGELEFPAPFGRKMGKEEKYIAALDEKTGASLKLTILNPDGRVWQMIAGGGASVIYTDTICDLGYQNELCNYGEYSGNPSMELTKEYARTILDLMTRKKSPNGKILLIGGGIANFTDIAATFTGIIAAIREYKEKLLDHKVRIFIRRGGPNYKVGLQNMMALSKETGIPMEVYGPETHMTKIVPHAIEALK